MRDFIYMAVIDVIPDNTDTPFQDLVLLKLSHGDYSTARRLITSSSRTLQEITMFELLGEWDGHTYPTLSSEKTTLEKCMWPES